MLALDPLWNVCLCLFLRSVTVCWSCSWATLEIAFTVLASLESVDWWCLSVPWSWPYLTSYPSATTTILFYTVRQGHAASLCPLAPLWQLMWLSPEQGTHECTNMSMQFMRLYLRVHPELCSSILSKGSTALSRSQTRVCCSKLCVQTACLCSPAELLYKFSRKFIISVPSLKARRARRLESPPRHLICNNNLPLPSFLLFFFHFAPRQCTLALLSVSVKGQRGFRKLKQLHICVPWLAINYLCLFRLVCAHLLWSRPPRHLQPAGQLEQLGVLRPRRDQTSGRHQQPVAAHGQRSAALRCGLGAHPALRDFLHRWFCWTWQLPSLHRWTARNSQRDWFVCKRAQSVILH